MVLERRLAKSGNRIPSWFRSSHLSPISVPTFRPPFPEPIFPEKDIREELHIGHIRYAGNFTLHDTRNIIRIGLRSAVHAVGRVRHEQSECASSLSEMRMRLRRSSQDDATFRPGAAQREGK